MPCAAHCMPWRPGPQESQQHELRESGGREKISDSQEHPLRMRWGIPYPLAGVHISHQLVQSTEADASEGVVRWRELYQYRAAPRVVLLTPWLDPADCRALSRSVAAEASVCECLRECIDGGRGGAPRKAARSQCRSRDFFLVPLAQPSSS